MQHLYIDGRLPGNLGPSVSFIHWQTVTKDALTAPVEFDLCGEEAWAQTPMTPSPLPPGGVRKLLRGPWGPSPSTDHPWQWDEAQTPGIDTAVKYSVQLEPMPWYWIHYVVCAKMVLSWFSPIPAMLWRISDIPPQLQGKGPQPNKNRLIVLDKFPQLGRGPSSNAGSQQPLGPLEVKTECCDPKQNQLLIM